MVSLSRVKFVREGWGGKFGEGIKQESRTVYASRECLFQGGGQNYDADCVVLGDTVKGSAIFTPEPISYGSIPVCQSIVRAHHMTYCSLNAFTGGLSQNEKRRRSTLAIRSLVGE